MLFVIMGSLENKVLLCPYESVGMKNLGKKSCFVTYQNQGLF